MALEPFGGMNRRTGGERSPRRRRAGLALLPALGGLLAASLACAEGARAPRPASGAPAPLIAILAYHDISDTAGTPALTVSQEFLRRQIRSCRAAGWTFLPLGELLAKRDHPEQLPPRVMVLTFDDGYRSFRDQALPVLREERVPATLAVISSFVNQAPGGMPPLLTWSDLRELARDTLVEIVSHSHDLHRYESSNPYRDTAPSVATRRYLLAEARYENREEYRSRIAGDLATARRTLGKELGRAPEVLVWPYGHTNVMAQGIAAAAGFPFTLTLGEREATLDDLRSGSLPRIMVTRRLRFTANDLAWLRPPAPAVRAAQVDLDGLYDPDPAVFSARVDRMVRNVRALGATDVFLQACSDAAGDGRRYAAWFTNHQVAVRADLWSMVAARLAHQHIRVWARVPTMNLTWAWQQHPEWRLGGATAAAQRGAGARTGKRDPAVERALAAWPSRLSPDLPEARRAAIDFLTDLAVYAPIDGVLFDDDAFIAPGERLTLDRSAGPVERTDAIQELLAGCREAVLAWRPLCVFGRNVPAAVVETPGAHAGLAQDFDRIVREDGLAVVMAYPWFNGQGKQPARWVETLGRRAVRRWNMAAAAGASAPRAGTVAGTTPVISSTAPVLFKLQTLDWQTGNRIPDRKLMDQVTAIRRAGVPHSGLYPVGADESDAPARLLDLAVPAPLATGAAPAR